MTIGNRGTWSEPAGVGQVADELRAYGRPLDGPHDLDDLIERLSDAEVVLLGEASHGTSEFYRWRASISAELIRDHDFSFVAVEGDWPSCFAGNRFVRDLPEAPETVTEAVDAFDRWPTWMWANWEAVEFFEWLALHNEGVPDAARTGFYGLDVYSLHESMAAVVDYLEDVDPDAAEHARRAYRCFEPYGEDGQEYAQAIRMVPEDCEEDVVSVLTDMQKRRAAVAGGETVEGSFDAEQNALVAKNAESYYRALASSENSWNVRDRHMAETLDRLREFHDGGKAIVWAHNTHVGDARATDMPRRGRLNLGELVREEYDDVEVVGFGTHRGDVIAADEWGDTPREMRVPEAQDGSYEDAFNAADAEDRLLFTDRIEDGDALAEPRGNRAIGVVYRPALESGNYVPTDLKERYDALIHIDETEALHALDTHPERERVPELYPYGV
ncbi:MAG: erythromycin esterase [Natronomonas sp.]|jgi:erythromycin esterase|uniref:erythromycin esterase family protein n=1 Tax=Natronomonas sp. TaxID=2184060 RepID=UPI003989D752